MGKIVNAAEYDYIGRKKLMDKLCDEYYYLKRGVIGRSCFGRDITALKLGSAEEYSLISAAFHGSESITAVVLLMFVESLCEAIKTDGYIGGINARRALNGRGVIFVPCVNPDGRFLSAAKRRAESLRRQLKSFAEVILSIGAQTSEEWILTIISVRAGRSCTSLK